MNRYSGFYLLDHHRNRNKPSGPASDADTRPWYETRNRCHHGHDRPHLLVIHDPETLEDFDPPYDEAERVAAYGATTTRASWHDSIDADSIIPMLPPEYTAWHVRGFNRCAIGMEVGAMAGTWNQAPAAWLDGVMANTAIRAAEHMAAYGIPPVLLFEPGRRYSTGLDPAGFGLISHHALDPTRRTDPGFTFPWNDLLNRLEAPMSVPDYAKPAVAKAVAGGFLYKGTEEQLVPRYDLMVWLDRLGALDDFHVDESGDVKKLHDQLADLRRRVDSLSVKGLPHEEVVTIVRNQ